MLWTVVIPVKALPGAKSRLTPATVDATGHRDLVAAIRADTIAAARHAEGVARVVLVVDRAVDGAADAVASGLPTEDVIVVVQHSAGLNGALRDAAGVAATRWGSDGVAALVGDLPAMRPDDLAAALRAASSHPRAFVSDAAGTGTTMLTATPGTALEPAFGAGSAQRHAVHATALPGALGLRHDVDTAADLDAATGVGVGPATSALLTTVPDTGRSGARGIVSQMSDACGAIQEDHVAEGDDRAPTGPSAASDPRGAR